MCGWSWGDEPETPEQALERRNALLQTEAADRAWAVGAADVSATADLLFAVLVDQFVRPERDRP